MRARLHNKLCLLAIKSSLFRNEGVLTNCLQKNVINVLCRISN